MPYAIGIIALLTLITAALSYLLHDPSLFLAAIIGLPMILNNVPWGLFLNPNTEEQEPPSTHAIGFGLPPEAYDEEDDEEDPRQKKRAAQ